MDEGGTSFGVICLAQCQTKLVVFVFSSSHGSWHAVAFSGWKDLTTATGNLDSGFEPVSSRHYYAHGCFCWVMEQRNKLLVIDTRKMELSGFDLPSIPQRHYWAIVEAGEGRLGLFTLCSRSGHGTYSLWYTILRNDARGANLWQLGSIIPLPLNYRYSMMGVAGGYLLLHGIPEDWKRTNLDWFSLNLKTLQLEWFCATMDAVILCPLYAGFPPSLSPPTI